jgi:hypothetical protein
MSDDVAKSLKDLVAAEANHRCGYCLTDQRLSGAQMHIEHLIPLARGGSSQRSNLWLSCAWCNSYKGTRTKAPDPKTGRQIALLDPRTQFWTEHFTWSDDGVRIQGLTATGRATVEALRMNNSYIVPARRLWVLAGWHPPAQQL